MARRLIFEIVGDDSSAEAAIRRTSRSVTGLDRNVGRAVRGAAAGSGVFRSLGRSLAFASGGFLAFASGADFLRKSVDQAKEAAVTQKQLAAQFVASKIALRPYQAEIDKTTAKLSVLAGFDDDELKAAFTTIFRSTRDVSKGLRDTGLAADIARGRHISFASAGTLVAKVEAGNVGLFRRMGVQVAKNATVEQALAAARARFAGQAAAGTTAQERFGALLQNTEQIIGAGILPTLKRYLSRGTVWLQQMDQSGRLQKDVAAGAHDVERAVSAGASAFNAAKSSIQFLDRVTGSFENTLKAFATTWLLIKTRTMAIKWGLIAAGEREVGTAAALSTAEVGGLEGALTRLKGLGPIPVAIALSFIPKASPSGNPNGFTNNPAAKKFANLPVLGPLFSQANKLSEAINNALGLTPGAPSKLSGSAFTGGQNAFAPGGSLNAASILEQSQKAANQTVANTVKGAAKRHVSLLGQFNLLELKFADAQRQGNMILQRSILVAEESLLLKLRDQAKTLAKRTGFAQQAASVEDQIRSIDASNVRDAKKAKDAATKAKKATGDFQIPLILQVAQARDQALGLTGAEKTVLQKMKKVARDAIRSGKLSLEGQLSAWQAIKDANDQLASGAQTAMTKFRKASTAALTAGLHLSAVDEKRLRARLSQFGPGGTVPKQGFTGAFGSAVAVPDVVIHTHVTLDKNRVGESVTRYQQKRRRRNPPTRSGPNRGS